MISPVIDIATEVAAVEFYVSLGTAERAAIAMGFTLFLGTVVLGCFPTVGERGVETARRSPIISGAIGTPAVLALFVLLWLARILAGDEVGVVFAVPIVIAATTLLAMGRAIGYVALGGAVARRLGWDSVWAWLLVGAFVSSVVAFAPVVGLVLELLALAVGVGTGVRVATGGGTSPNAERPVPPANKV